MGRERVPEARDIARHGVAQKPEILHRPCSGVGIAGAARVGHDHGNEAQIARVLRRRLDPDSVSLSITASLAFGRSSGTI